MQHHTRLAHCYACAEALTPALGPTVLWALRPPASSRHAFHLACWLRWCRQEEPARAA